MEYRIFISHAWEYRETYWDIKAKLNTAAATYYGFSWRDYSIPDHNPLLDAKGALLTAPRLLNKAIETRIDQSSVVLCPARMFIYHSQWVQRELMYANSVGKRTIAIRSRSSLRTPVELEKLCDQVVDSNYRSIYNAIVA